MKIKYFQDTDTLYLFGDEVRGNNIEDLYKKGMYLASLHEKTYRAPVSPGSQSAKSVPGSLKSTVSCISGSLITKTRERFQKYLAISA
jgi:hypothetical protein